MRKGAIARLLASVVLALGPFALPAVGDIDCGVVGTASSGALGDAVLAGAVTIDTDTGDITDGGGLVVSGGAIGVEEFTQPPGGLPFPLPVLRVYHFQSLHVAPGAIVTVVGTRGLALLVSETILVEGDIDLSGADGSSGSANTPGLGGAGVAGGYAGGEFVVGPGCVAGNGMGDGPGAGLQGECGANGGDGSDGQDGGGGGGGGGACGASAGAGAGHSLAGGDGGVGLAGSGGDAGGDGPGSGGAEGEGCLAGPPTSAGGAPYGDPGLNVLYGGSGGSSGGFGGRGGFGGWGLGADGTGYGGDFGFTGGPGGGGGGGGAALLCALISVQVDGSGAIDASGGSGGLGGVSNASSNGTTALFGSSPIGGGGGGGASGTGGGGGGGSGGSLFIMAPVITIDGALDASGGIGAAGGSPAGSPGAGAAGRNGGASGGVGGPAGSGGWGGDGADGYIVLETATAPAIELSVTRGPAPDEVTVRWTGGLPIYDIHRSSDPADVDDPIRIVGTTSGTTWIDSPPPGAHVVYYLVLGS